jgi:hypothetical protein
MSGMIEQGMGYAGVYADLKRDMVGSSNSETASCDQRRLYTCFNTLTFTTVVNNKQETIKGF